MPNGREMNLREWAERLPKIHRARAQYNELISLIEYARDELIEENSVYPIASKWEDRVKKIFKELTYDKRRSR